MAIQVREIADGRSSSEDSATGERHYTRTFQAITDSPLIGPRAVRAAVPVARFDPHPEDAEALAISIAPEHKSDHINWHVKVEYSSLANPLDADPMGRRPKQRWSTEPFTRPAIRTVDSVDPVTAAPISSRAITNSAGDPFDPPQEMDDATWTLTYTRNEAFFDPIISGGYINTVNDAPFFGFQQGEAKIKSIDATETEEGDLIYYEITYVIQFREHWRLKPLDAGYRQLGDSPDVRKSILDARGLPVSQPAMLDGSGLPLVIAADTTGFFLDFQVYPERSYAPLEIF